MENQTEFENLNLPKIEKNQLSIENAKKYFHILHGKNLDFWDQVILPKLQSIAIKVAQSWPERRKHHRKNSFELLGFDIMLDENFDPYLLGLLILIYFYLNFYFILFLIFIFIYLFFVYFLFIFIII